jgi:hypothetical protein
MPEKDLSKQQLRLLLERFPKLTNDLARRHQPLMLSLLERKDENPPDYSGPGEWGKHSDPHMVHVWRSDGKDWEELVLKEFYPCDSIVIEVGFRYLDTKCPPENGFASMVKKASKEARRIAEGYECPDDCGGSLVDIIYKHWYCQEDDLVIEIQLERRCWVA